MFIFESPCKDKEEFFNDFLVSIKSNDSDITGLDIRGEDLSPNQFLSLFEALGHNASVENLILRGMGYNCDLSSEIISVGLSNLLQDSKTINALTLYFTGLNDQGMKHIAKALSDNSTLTYLKIWGHELKLEGELSLVKMLANNKTLKEIVVDHISTDAGLVMLSQQEYLNPLKCSINSSYTSSSGTIISQINDFDESFIIRNKERKLVEERVREKTKAVDDLLVILQRQNFSEDFIKITKNFCLDNFLIKHNNIVKEYEFLAQDRKIALVELDKEYTKAPIGAIKIADKIAEIEKDYDNKQSKLYIRFNEIQYENMQLFAETEQQISNHNKVVKLRDHKITTDNEQTIIFALDRHSDQAHEIRQDEAKMSANEKLDNSALKVGSKIELQAEIEPKIELKLEIDAQIAEKPVKILYDNELEAPIIKVISNKEHKVVKNEFKGPIVKRLDISEELQGPEYVTEWAQKVMEAGYDTVVFSVGSSRKIEQQLPSFSKGLGKVAILNIDHSFQSSDTQNTSKFDNISVNYLQAPLQTPERNKIFGSTRLKENYKEDPSTITQETLIDDICKLMDSEQKVILLSHISVPAPRLFFDKILSHPDILSKYEKDFIFIHSYFEQEPTIICSKNFVNSMISPDPETMSKYLSTHEPIYQDIEVVKDNILIDKIWEVYAQSERSSARSLKLPNDATIYRNLFEINAEDIMPMLGLNENSFFDNDSFLQ